MGQADLCGLLCSMFNMLTTNISAAVGVFSLLAVHFVLCDRFLLLSTARQMRPARLWAS